MIKRYLSLIIIFESLTLLVIYLLLKKKIITKEEIEIAELSEDILKQLNEVLEKENEIESI